MRCGRCCGGGGANSRITAGEVGAERGQRVQAPVLFIVGENDPQVLQLNKQAAGRLIADEISR
jgi:hypothetical protein